MISAVEAESGIPDSGISHFRVQSKLAVLNGELARAEQLLLQQGLVEEAMEMYQELHKYDESIRLAERKNHPKAAQNPPKPPREVPRPPRTLDFRGSTVAGTRLCRAEDIYIYIYIYIYIIICKYMYICNIGFPRNS